MADKASLTPELRATIVEAVSRGSRLQGAVRRAGVSWSTFRWWMDKGDRETDGPYRALRDDVVKAMEAGSIHRPLKKDRTIHLYMRFPP